MSVQIDQIYVACDVAVHKDCQGSDIINHTMWGTNISKFTPESVQKDILDFMESGFEEVDSLSGWKVIRKEIEEFKYSWKGSDGKIYNSNADVGDIICKNCLEKLNNQQ